MSIIDTPFLGFSIKNELQNVLRLRFDTKKRCFGPR